MVFSKMQKNSVKIQMYSEKLINLLFDTRKKYVICLFIPKFLLIN